MKDEVKTIIKSIEKGKPAFYDETNINQVFEELIKRKYVIDRNFKQLDGVALIASFLTDYEKTYERVMNFYKKSSYNQELIVNNKDVKGISLENSSSLLKALYNNNKSVPSVLLEMDGLNFAPQIAALLKGQYTFVYFLSDNNKAKEFTKYVEGNTAAFNSLIQGVKQGLSDFEINKYNFDQFHDNIYFVVASFLNSIENTSKAFEEAGVDINDIYNEILKNDDLKKVMVTAFLQQPEAAEKFLKDGKKTPPELETHKKETDVDDKLQYEMPLVLSLIKGTVSEDVFEKYGDENVYLLDKMLTEVIEDVELVSFLCDYIHQSYHPMYTEKHENKLLGLLKTDAKSLEEYIYSIKDKKNITLIEAFAIEYYGKKTLAKYGKEETRIINLFGFEEFSDQSFGKYNSRTKNITIYTQRSCQSVKEILETLHHELAHSIQFDLVKAGDIDIDDDIDLYSKDIILKNELPLYYKNNYWSISYEFDAEFRAMMMSNELYGTQEAFNYSIDRLYDKVVKEKNKGKEISYKDTNIREYRGKEYPIDDLFIDMFSKLPYDKAKEYYDEYPTIKYSYDINLDEGNKHVTINKRTLRDYAKLYAESKDEKDKKMYLKLIEKEFDTERYGIIDIMNKIDSLGRIRRKLDDESLNKLCDNLYDEIKNKYTGLSKLMFSIFSSKRK